MAMAKKKLMNPSHVLIFVEIVSLARFVPLGQRNLFNK